MGRQVRRVPRDWQHPQEWRRGRLEFVPLLAGPFKATHEEWIADKAAWDRGERPKYWQQGSTNDYVQWAGPEPLAADYMPEWPEAERTHWQMYENTSEGTPISPVMETPHALARWLADNNASWFGGHGATFEQWFSMILRYS